MFFLSICSRKAQLSKGVRPWDTGNWSTEVLLLPALRSTSGYFYNPEVSCQLLSLELLHSAECNFSLLEEWLHISVAVALNRCKCLGKCVPLNISFLNSFSKRESYPEQLLAIKIVIQPALTPKTAFLSLQGTEIQTKPEVGHHKSITTHAWRSSFWKDWSDNQKCG